MLHLLRLALRVVSYGALGLVALGIACMVFVNVSGVCSRFDEGAVQCSAPVFETIGGFGLMIVLVASITIAPVILALVGLVFLVRDVTAAVRRR